RVWLNFEHNTRSDTPYCSASETAVAKQSIRPETVDPSFAVVMKISPGWPSSYSPTVRYPSYPPTLKWWTIACRSSGRRRRTGCTATESSISAIEHLQAKLRYAGLGPTVPRPNGPTVVTSCPSKLSVPYGSAGLSPNRTWNNSVFQTKQLDCLRLHFQALPSQVLALLSIRVNRGPEVGAAIAMPLHPASGVYLQPLQPHVRVRRF